jgi:hypothetical protein
MHFDDVRPISPVAGYVGGKRQLAKRLIPLFPAVDHVLYAEPFVGMGGVFFRRDQRHTGFLQSGAGLAPVLWRARCWRLQAVGRHQRFKAPEIPAAALFPIDAIQNYCICNLLTRRELAHCKTVGDLK